MLIVLDVAIVVKEFSNRCARVVSVGTGLLVARVEVWLVVLVEAAVVVVVLSFAEDVEPVGTVVVAWGRGSESS